MPRFSRGSIKTTYFHVMTQGINKSYIFDKPEDIKYYIKIMYELKEEHKLRIVAYCIMNNHTHLLIHVKKTEELSKYMQRLNIKYAYYYNKKYNRVGYVFRDRYKSEGIYSEKQLYTCIKYIYDNPVNAGICTNPEQYPYSNYKKVSEKLIEPNKYSFIDVEENKEDEYKKEIENFINENSIKLNNMREYNEKLTEIIKILREKHGLSFRKIGKELNVSSEKVRKIFNSS